MMMHALRSLFANTRKPSFNPRAVAHRLHLEHLGERTMPNAAPIQHLVANIQHTLADVQSDIQAVKSALGTTTNSTVTTDVTKLTTDAAKVAADLVAGTSATADITTLRN